MNRHTYNGQAEHEGNFYDYAVIIDKPNEITTLTIKGKGLEDSLIVHGLILSNSINWTDNKLREELLARTVVNYIDFNKNIISKVHAEIMAEYERELKLEPALHKM